MKDIAVFHVSKVLEDKTKRRRATGVLKEQYIPMAVKHNGREEQPLRLRRIFYKTEEGKVDVFITNNFTLPPTLLAVI